MPHCGVVVEEQKSQEVLGTAGSTVSSCKCSLFVEPGNTNSAPPLAVSRTLRISVGFLATQDQLQSWIRGNVSACARSIFIFDEMDK